MKKIFISISVVITSCIGISACTAPKPSAYQEHKHTGNQYVFATEILQYDFETTKRVLRILEIASNCLEDDKPVSKETFCEIIEIIRELSDKQHQEKEDKVLFPFLKSARGGEKKDFLGQLLMEHISARDKIRDLSDSITNIYQGKKAKKKIAKVAYAYIEYMKRHLHREEKTLFPWINEVLTHDEQLTLISKFEVMEKEDIDSGVYKKYITMIETLEKELKLCSR